MEWYEPEVQALEERLSKQPLPHKPVVFYGSSTIRLWDTLERDIGSRRVVNLGFGGSTLEACVYFFERLMARARPCSLVIYAGDNDLGDGRLPGDVLASFRALSKKVRSDLVNVAFGFISIKPSRARMELLDRIREANELIKPELKEHRRGYYINVFDAMLDATGKPRTELFADDGLHLSVAGYRLWTRLLGPFRNQILTEDCLPIQNARLLSNQGDSRVSQVAQPEPES